MVARRGLIAVVAAVVVLAGAAFVAGLAVAARGAGATRPEAPEHGSREFMFQVIDLQTRNQGGQTINLFFHYRYNSGITEVAIPDYLSMRKSALDYLATVDVSNNPYWETLNSQMCRQLKHDFPVEAITCELQVHGNDTPGPHYEPGDHASIETLGDIEPLAVPGPSTPTGR